MLCYSMTNSIINLKMNSPRVSINPQSWMHPRYIIMIDTTDGSPSVQVGSKMWNNLPECEAKQHIELLNIAIEELNDKLRRESQ